MSIISLPFGENFPDDNVISNPVSNLFHYTAPLQSSSAARGMVTFRLTNAVTVGRAPSDTHRPPSTLHDCSDIDPLESSFQSLQTDMYHAHSASENHRPLTIEWNNSFASLPLDNLDTEIFQVDSTPMVLPSPMEFDNLQNSLFLPDHPGPQGPMRPHEAVARRIVARWTALSEEEQDRYKLRSLNRQTHSTWGTYRGTTNSEALGGQTSTLNLDKLHYIRCESGSLSNEHNDILLEDFNDRSSEDIDGDLPVESEDTTSSETSDIFVNISNRLNRDHDV